MISKKRKERERKRKGKGREGGKEKRQLVFSVYKDSILQDKKVLEIVRSMFSIFNSIEPYT